MLKYRKICRALGCFVLLVMLFFTNGAYCEDPDYNIWSGLLSDHVAKGLVDYDGFKKDEAKLDSFLDLAANVDISALVPDEQYAYYINLYNAWTIKLILSKYPHVTSIKELGSFFSSPWQKKIVKTGNSIVSLDHIEHDILRPKFKDPRVHFVVNCASISCPPLGSMPYEASLLNRQLESAVTGFINDGENVILKENKLYVSRIFKFYKEDFKEGIFEFIFKYATGGLKTNLEEKKEDIKIKYLPYNWNLNNR